MDRKKNLENRNSLKQNEDLYIDSEQCYREIYDNTSVGLYRTTPDGKILMVNTATLKMLGYSSLEDLQQRNLEHDGYSPDYSRETFKKIMQEIGNLKGHEAIWNRKDGTSFYVRESAKAVKDKTGKVLYYDGVLEDITDKKQIENALRESEEKFRTLYDNTVFGLYRSTPDGEIIMVNQTIVNMLGYDSREELMSENLGNGHYTTDYGREQFKIEMKEKGEIKGKEAKWTKKTGEKIYIRESARAFHDENGKIVYYDGVVEDITDKKQIENALRESEQRLSLALESTNLGLWDLNNKTGEVYRNDIWAEMLGYTADEVKNDLNFFESIVHPDDIQDLRYKSKTAAKYLGTKFDVEHRMRTKDGNWKWIRDWGKVIEWDENHKPVRIIGTHLDIDEEKKMQLALKESEEKFRQLFESSTDFMCVMDLKGTFTDVNPAAERITGYKRDELIGLNFIEYTTSKTKIGVLRAFMKNLKYDKPLIDYPIEVNIKGKGIRHFEGSIVPIRKEGLTIGFQGSARDITHRINNEKQLLEQQDHIKLINRILRHDISNCLAIIQSALNIYNRTNNNNMLDEIIKQVKKGSELIGKMRQLEESHIGNKTLKSNSLAKVVKNITKDYSEIAINLHGKGSVMADEALDSVIENIMSNVVKHARATAVDITIERNQDECKLSIADNGKGISDEVKENIFFESYKSGSTGNTGLGLFIVKKTIERYGGSVAVKDNKPKGTIFELTFPI